MYRRTRPIETQCRNCNNCAFNNSINFTGIGAENIILPPGLTVRFTCTGPPELSLPTWYINGDFAVEGEESQCYRLNFPEDGNVTTATLTINGNLTCDTFDIYCAVEVSKSEFRNQHNISLEFQGLLQHHLIDMNLHQVTS